MDRICHMQVTIALLKNAMIKSSSDRFLVDGFPRALDQAEIFERDIMPCQMVRLMTSLHRATHCNLQCPPPSCCSYLLAPHHDAATQLLNSWQCRLFQLCMCSVSPAQMLLGKHRAEACLGTDDLLRVG